VAEVERTLRSLPGELKRLEVRQVQSWQQAHLNAVHTCHLSSSD
jgi:hypothetical protein